MNIINANQLKSRLDKGDPVIMINALEEPKFIAKHIPGSLNLFTKEAIEISLKKDQTIVVYCTDQSCNKSISLYYLLEAMGYQDIYRFPGGLREWEENGNPLEGEMVNVE